MSDNSRRLVSEDGSATLFSARYGETYHSSFGALTEAQLVFVQSSGVARRISHHQATHVLEIGFGLGLNFLLSADLAYCCNTALGYHAFEHDLPDIQALESMNYAALLKHPQLAEDLLKAIRNTPAEAPIEAALTPLIQLRVERQDASKARLSAARYQAIYLDAFSPASNPECWSPQFIATLAQALTSDGRLATYSAKGCVRRAMLATGLRVEKRPGPPGKREFLIASKAQEQTPAEA